MVCFSTKGILYMIIPISVLDAFIFPKKGKNIQAFFDSLVV